MAPLVRKPDGVRRERARCNNIVADYRSQLERALVLKPHASNVSQVRRMIAMLRCIERDILAVPEGGQKLEAILAGDFSIEEMERAQEIIAEQERNPFEVEG